MNIFWHMPTFRPHCCGLSIRAIRLASGLRAQGHDITFLVDAEKTDISGGAIEDMPVRTLTVAKHAPLHWCLQATARFKTARLIARRIGTDCDVMISCQPEVVAAYAGLPHRPPVVFVCGSSTVLHDEADRSRQASLPLLRRIPYLMDRWLKRRHERMAFTLADSVVFDSLQTRDRVIAEYDLSPGHIHTVHGGVNVAAYQPADQVARHAARASLGIGDEGIVVVWTGRFSPEKNLRLLIEALPHCLHRPGRVLLVGGGPDRDELADLARRLNVHDIVQFVGERQDVRPFLHAADIFAFPSRGESFGGSLVEGLACGLPAVGLRPDGKAVRNANCEIIEHGRCGLLVDRPDPGEFAAALDRLAVDATLRCRFGSAGRDWVAGHYTWNKAARQLDRLVLSLADAPS
jgi:glycosyltransferase involved in cell wall biosynthesis